MRARGIMMSTRALSNALGLAVALLATNIAVAADDTGKTKVQQKDFTDKIDDVRRAIERDRDRNQPPAGRNATTDQLVIDVCKKNPKLPQCRL